MNEYLKLQHFTDTTCIVIICVNCSYKPPLAFSWLMYYSDIKPHCRTTHGSTIWLNK